MAEKKEKKEIMNEVEEKEMKEERIKKLWEEEYYSRKLERKELGAV